MKFLRLKRGIARLLLICMITSIFQITARADSNSLVPTYIGLMKGRGIKDIDTINSFQVQQSSWYKMHLMQV